jgi:hypothetical protein
LKSGSDALLSDAFNHCIDYDNLRAKQHVWMLRRRTEAVMSIEPEFSPPWESIIGEESLSMGTKRFPHPNPYANCIDEGMRDI